MNIRFRGCLYSSLSAGIFPFANNFNPLHFYNFLLTNRINGRLASPDDNLRQICSSYSNFKFCTSGVNVAECPVTQLYSNWFSLAFDVCKSAERQFPLLSALKCLSTNAFDGNSQSSCSQSAKNLLGQMSADDLTEFGDLRHFCSDVADFIKCLRGSTVNLCGPDGPATFSHAESHVGDLLAGMWGSDCQLEFHTHLSDSGDKINSTVPNSLRR